MLQRLSKNIAFYSIVILMFFTLASGDGGGCSCRRGQHEKEEQIRVEAIDSLANPDSLLNTLRGNVSFSQIPTAPNAVIRTGLPEHRLVSVYKVRKEKEKKPDGTESSYSSYYDYGGYSWPDEEHFMPGLDVVYGYNLLNIAHYNLKTLELNFLFNQPALIKTLYYPSFVQDSLNMKPINRHYYLVSVYDEDTNRDTLIDRRDLRRFYLFDASAKTKIQVVPDDYSVLRSQYDSMNDIMYLFARHDSDRNGTTNKKDPIHIFWFSLDTPGVAKEMY